MQKVYKDQFEYQQKKKNCMLMSTTTLSKNRGQEIEDIINV